MKNQFLIFVNVLFSISALKSVNGQLRRRANKNDSNINSNSNENIGSIDPCKGLCKNGSTCMEGIAQSPANFKSSVGYGDGDDRAYHCECPYGWTGVRCDIVYESCSLESSPSDSSLPSDSTPHYQHECYNNGKCVPGKFDDYGHEQLFCDCSDAFDEDGNMYAGKYCEHQVIDYCSDEKNFCLNGAICNKDYPEFGGPCMCHGDFEGLRCESRKNSVPKSAQIIMQNTPNLAPQCDLTCLNGGYCVMHTSVRIEDGESEGTNLNTDVIDRISKYCACPTGYDGPTCEIEKEEEEHGQESKEEYDEEYKQKYEKVYIKEEEEECTGNNCEKNNKEIKACGSGYCYNGGTCVKSSIFSGNDNDDEQVYCDCSTATTHEVSYAGRSCQYEATSYCSDDSRLHGHLFCVNGGMCKDNIYKGCDCLDGFGGFSCEFTTSKTHESHTTTAATSVSSNPVSINDYSSTLDSPSFHDSSQNSFTTVAKIDTETGKEISSNQIAVVTKEEVELEKSKCGDGYCAHGSVCVVSSIDGKGSYCDCDTVTTNDASFAGRFCQYEATSYCAKNPGINHHLFCVNDGSCKKDMFDDSNGSIGCDCKNGFMGFNCQMTIEEFTASTLIPYDIDSSTGDEEESNVDLQLINEKQRSIDDIKHLSAEGTLDHSDQSVSMPSSLLQSEEEEEIAETLEKNENDATENISTTLEMSGDQSTLSIISNEPPVDDNKKSVLVPPFVDDPAYIKCDNSKCTNGGICRKGAKQHGSEKISKIVRDIDHLDATYDSKNFDHCVCRPGFTGLRCEHEIETCNGDGGDINVEEEEHFCLHGSKCTKVTDNDNLQQQHGCDCSTTTSNISPVFAGKSCEHKSTSICTKAGEILPGKPLSFCVNGGSCLKEVSNNESHAGCECPANWSGPHCELHNDDSNKKDETIEIEPAAETTAILKSSLSEKQEEYNAFSSLSGSSNSKFRILSRFLIVVGSLVLVLMMIAYVKKRQQRRKCAKEMKSFLTNNNSNNARFTDNPLLQTPDNSINLAPKQDYNYDGIPLRPPSVTAIANNHYQPDPVDMIIDSMGKGKGIGMESSDSTPETNQYITGRNRRGENNNHQIL